MAKNPLRNLSSSDLIDAALNFGFKFSTTHGDDSIYVHPITRKFVKITLNRKEGTPIRTVDSIIRSSCIPKTEWREWFSNKRDRK